MPAFEELTIRLPDGYRAYARLWKANPSRAAVLFLHGIQSHAGWYDLSASRLAQAGFTVLQPDRRGSGSVPEFGWVATVDLRGLDREHGCKVV